MDRKGHGHSPDGMLPQSPSPQPLASAAQASSDVAPALDLRQLFETHMAFVWRNLRRLGVPPSMVEDATQDVFLVVHRRRDSFRPERSTVETWLFGIVLRVARNYRRAQQRRLAWLLPIASPKTFREAATPDDGPADILAQRESARVFDRALDALDEAKRAVFLLVDVEQLAVTEAAAALGINLNTAYWRLRKARIAFRRALMRLRTREGAQRGDRP
jgi:RNA polymerase sigma-70 factor, ECF subfamily